MHTDAFLIEKVKKLFESKLGWGDCKNWTNPDFVTLSEKIQEQTGVALSHVTLKRIWGRVKYDSIPNTHTLDTLVQFLGYENWREFKTNEENKTTPADIENYKIQKELNTDLKAIHKNNKYNLKVLSVVAVSGLLVLLFMLNNKTSNNPSGKTSDNNYKFNSKKVVSEGLPNSVIFNYDATKSPYDSVIIQQSWDKNLQTKVSKNQHFHTSIYYYPDYYNAKLIVDNRIVSTHKLLIKSQGWLPMVAVSPVPVYFKKKDAIADGKMTLSLEKMKSRNINMQPSAPYVLYANVRDFGEIYSDDFIFEASLKNDYREGSAVCQLTKIYLLCEGTAIGIPLCAKGCVSDLEMFFTDYYVSGKQADLSAFGVNFDSFVKVRIESKNKKAFIFLNDKLVYTVDRYIVRSKIIGIDFSFQATGSVDYVKLVNSKVNYKEDF